MMVRLEIESDTLEGCLYVKISIIQEKAIARGARKRKPLVLSLDHGKRAVFKDTF
jgi:hypothetical protein